MRIVFWVSFYVWSSAGLLVLGTDMVRALEDGRFHPRSVVDLWSAMAAPGLDTFGARIDPYGLLLGQAAILVCLAMAGLSYGLAAAWPKKRRRIFAPERP